MLFKEKNYETMDKAVNEMARINARLARNRALELGRIKVENKQLKKAISALYQAGKLYTDQLARILKEAPRSGITINWEKSVYPLLKQILGDKFEQVLKGK